MASNIGERVIDTVLKYFPTAVVDTTNSQVIRVTVKCDNPASYSKVMGNIIEITIAQPVMYIDRLIKCDSMNGTAVLNHIINIAYELRASTHPRLGRIGLTDGSALMMGDPGNICILDLKTLYIILYGESWYNQRGFYSKNHAADYEHNGTIRMMTGYNPEDPDESAVVTVKRLYESGDCRGLLTVLEKLELHVHYDTQLWYDLK